MNTKRNLIRVLLVLSLGASAALASPSFAAPKGSGAHQGKRGGTSYTGTFILVRLNSTDGVLHYGQDVTFDVTSTAPSPFVTLTCYQGGDWVTNQSVGFYPGYPWSQVFPLRSWKWTAGAADCTADLWSMNSDGSRGATLASMSFHVEA